MASAFPKRCCPRVKEEPGPGRQIATGLSGEAQVQEGLKEEQCGGPKKKTAADSVGAIQNLVGEAAALLKCLASAKIKAIATVPIVCSFFLIAMASVTPSNLLANYIYLTSLPSLFSWFLLAVASNLLAMASNLLARASALTAASDVIANIFRF